MKYEDHGRRKGMNKLVNGVRVELETEEDL